MRFMLLGFALVVLCVSGCALRYSEEAYNALQVAERAFAVAQADFDAAKAKVLEWTDIVVHIRDHPEVDIAFALAERDKAVALAENMAKRVAAAQAAVEDAQAKGVPAWRLWLGGALGVGATVLTSLGLGKYAAVVKLIQTIVQAIEALMNSDPEAAKKIKAAVSTATICAGNAPKLDALLDGLGLLKKSEAAAAEAKPAA